MTDIHHDIHHEFPEHRERIIALKTSDDHFHKLAEEYSAVTHEVEKLERAGNPDSDEYLETLKKQRLHLKDQLFHILNTAK
jgi:uncharacterized protein